MVHKVWPTRPLGYFPISFPTSYASLHSSLPGLLVVPLKCQAHFYPRVFALPLDIHMALLRCHFFQKNFVHQLHHFVLSPTVAFFIAHVTLPEHTCLLSDR